MTQSETKAIPDGLHTITPHLVVRDAGRAAEWYKAALGAEERGRIPVPGGKFMQIELRFGDSAVMLADEFPGAGVLSPLAIGGTPVVLHFSTENVDALWKRAIDAGATVLQPLQEQFWGDRYGQIIDPFGYRWGLAQHIRDVSSEEIARHAAKVFGGQE
ncbi:MAG: VOC family protein [Chloroflexota bacterium]|nr:VOC family protein [Chloroflexota bacterium]